MKNSLRLRLHLLWIVVEKHPKISSFCKKKIAKFFWGFLKIIIKIITDEPAIFKPNAKTQIDESDIIQGGSC